MATLGRHLEISERQSFELMAAGSAAGALVAVAAVLAAVIGLVGGAPLIAAACAAFAIGAGLVFEGGAIGARFVRSLARDDEDSLTKGDVGGGMTADLVAGVVGLVLGALALFDVAPMSMIGTAVVVYAAALVLGSAALVHATTTSRDGVPVRTAGTDTVMLAAAAQLVLGLVVLVLGSIVLLGGGGSGSLMLALLALLLVGVSELASGMAIGTKVLGVLKAPAH